MSGHDPVVPPEFEQAILRMAVLKGITEAQMLADALGKPIATVNACLSHLADSEILEAVGQKIRPTTHGKIHAKALIEKERRSLDPLVAYLWHEEFSAINTTVKEKITAWQFDTGRDHFKIVPELDEQRCKVVPLLNQMAAPIPRLTRYHARLDGALMAARHGDLAWIASPMLDSFHTVWFELHQELIDLAGLTRDPG